MSEWELPSSVESQSIERVGGGYAWESGVYDATIKLVYLNQSQSEAVSFNVVLENSEGKELTETMWIRSGKAKGHKTYYTGKDGVDRPLPGYSVANSLCVAATGESLAAAMTKAERKTIKIYDYEQKKEVPTERPVLMHLGNLKVKVAVHQIVEDKRKQNSAGQYEPTGETRTVNECKFFGNEAGKTAEEITDDKPAEMFDKWAAKNTGQVIDKTSKDKAASGTQSAADIMGGASDSGAESSGGNSLFG